MSVITEDLLKNCLSIAVPLAIANYLNNPLQLEQDSRSENLSKFVNVISNHGDEILYKSPKKGKTSEGFQVLSKAIAILSFRPGGVKFMGLHFEANPTQDFQ